VSPLVGRGYAVRSELARPSSPAMVGNSAIPVPTERTHHDIIVASLHPLTQRPVTPAAQCAPAPLAESGRHYQDLVPTLRRQIGIQRWPPAAYARLRRNSASLAVNPTERRSYPIRGSTLPAFCACCAACSDRPDSSPCGETLGWGFPDCPRLQLQQWTQNTRQGWRSLRKMSRDPNL
jgi:hypothetical protein